MTQEDAAEKIGVSAQAISKWEAGDCLPDCFNLKAISDLYKLSAYVLLETESGGDIDAAASKIEQIGTKFIWSNANTEQYSKNLRRELGEDLWKMWKGLYIMMKMGCCGLIACSSRSFNSCGKLLTIPSIGGSSTAGAHSSLVLFM